MIHTSGSTELTILGRNYIGQVCADSGRETIEIGATDVFGPILYKETVNRMRLEAQMQEAVDAGFEEIWKNKQNEAEARALFLKMLFGGK